MTTVFRSRGALLGQVAGLFVMRPRPERLVRGIVAALVVVAALYVSGLSITVAGREVSAEAAVVSVVSIFGDPSQDEVGSNYVGTRDWRSDWWGAIWDDVTADRMLLHSHGWGDNLSIRYGIVPTSLESDPRVLRLPHNIFYSLAGRAGLVAAIAFLAVPVVTVVRSFRPQQQRGRSDGTGRTLVEVGRAGVTAAVVVGLTDVYLERPPGADPVLEPPRTALVDAGHATRRRAPAPAHRGGVRDRSRRSERDRNQPHPPDSLSLVALFAVMMSRRVSTRRRSPEGLASDLARPS